MRLGRKVYDREGHSFDESLSYYFKSTCLSLRCNGFIPRAPAVWRHDCQQGKKITPLRDSERSKTCIFKQHEHSMLLPFFIRTITVGSGFLPDLLTLISAFHKCYDIKRLRACTTTQMSISEWLFIHTAGEEFHLAPKAIDSLAAYDNV